MARFNEILVGRYNRLVQKLFSMKGPASLVTLSDEMMPVFPLFHGAENRYLEGWNRFASAQNIAASAANTSCLRLRNPTGSNLLVCVEKVSVAFSLADTTNALFRGTATTDLGTVGSVLRMDSRGNPNSSAILSVQNNAATAPPLTGGLAMWGTFAAANTLQEIIYQEDQELPLLPGDAIQMQAGNVNEGLLVSIWWRERFLEDSERS